MNSIAFRKYSLNGNTFVFVDETDGPLLSEAQKSAFAFSATSAHFGIGADNLIFLQPCTETVLREIQDARGYWQKPPPAASADFIFRMFESNGAEAFCCGNALLCIADHLCRRHGRERHRVMTRIPMKMPRVVAVGFDGQRLLNWVNLGRTENLPPFMIQGPVETVNGGPLQRIRHLRIDFGATHPDLPVDARTLDLTGHLVFTGEPHLILMASGEFSDPYLAEALFTNPSGDAAETEASERRRGRNTSRLVHYIGTYLNRACAALFPFGINVNFVRTVASADAIEYRCFERGINHETLACGTGAVAASAVVSELGLLPGGTFRIRPHRCRWYKPDAEFFVRNCADGWHLYGRPDLLYEGVVSPWGPAGQPFTPAPGRNPEENRHP